MARSLGNGGVCHPILALNIAIAMYKQLATEFSLVFLPVMLLRMIKADEKIYFGFT